MSAPPTSAATAGAPPAWRGRLVRRAALALAGLAMVLLRLAAALALLSPALLLLWWLFG